MPWVCRRVVVELVEICTLSLSKCPRFGALELQFPPPSNFPYFLVLFLASPKKKGEKEGRLPAEHGSAQAGRSDAAGLLFRELLLNWTPGVVPFGVFSFPDTMAVDGITRKSPFPATGW